MSFLQFIKSDIIFILLASLSSLLRPVSALMPLSLTTWDLVIKVFFHHTDFLGVVNLGVVNTSPFGCSTRALRTTLTPFRGQLARSMGNRCLLSGIFGSKKSSFFANF